MMPRSDIRRTSQVERHRIFQRAFFFRQVERSWCVAEILETRQAPRLRFIRVDRPAFVVASAGWGGVVDAGIERATAPAIDTVDDERAEHSARRLQRGR